MTFDAAGLARFNEPLVAQLAAGGVQTTPLLVGTLQALAALPSAPLAPLLETLYVANRLADAGVANIGEIYPAASAFNAHPHPLAQAYLAGLYRKINRPEAFGPLLSTLTRQSIVGYPAAQAPLTGLSEEVGGALLQLIANRAADETVRRLAPYLQPPVVNSSV